MSNQKLTTEERLLNLEENMNYIKELLEVNNDSYNELIKALNVLKEGNTNYQEEVTNWAETVEDRIGRLMVENVNLTLIIGEAIKLTPQQRKNIEDKIKYIKEEHEKGLENQASDK